MRKIFKIAVMAILLSTPVLAYDPFGFDLLGSPYNYNPLNPTHRSLVNSAMEEREKNDSNAKDNSKAYENTKEYHSETIDTSGGVSVIRPFIEVLMDFALFLVVLTFSLLLLFGLFCLSLRLVIFVKDELRKLWRK